MNKVIKAIVELITALLSNSASPLYFTSVAATPHGVRRVFFGDPQSIPNDDFPCVVVRPVSSTLQKEGTRDDTNDHEVEVVVVENLRNYSDDDPDDPSKVNSVAQVMDMMEKMNTAQQVSGTSIVGKLLANQKLPYTESGTQYAAIKVTWLSVDYVFNNSRGFPTFEVIAKFRVTSMGIRA